MPGDLEEALRIALGPQYTIESEIKAGGMSRVFIVGDEALSRRVVVKVLHPQLAATVSIQRFEREITFAAGLQHPHIVPVLRAGQVDGLPFLMMPYIEGESLRTRVARGPLSLRETVGIMKDVARALAYAHAAGIVHRDIKPDNILLSLGSAVVTDFGVAKAVTASRERNFLENAKRITGVGISLGTPMYMSPEQAAADPAMDHRSDIYSLGVVAYEMLTGSPPFHGRTPQELLTAQLTELPLPIAARRYDVPKPLASVVMQCLEKNPGDRPRTASELVRTLDTGEILTGPVAVSPRAARVSVMRYVRLGIGALVAAALLVWAWRWTRTTEGAVPLAQASSTEAPSVTVFSFVPLGDGATESATAMTAQLVTSLSNVAGLRVKTRMGATPDAVDPTATVSVYGTVQRSGQRIRVNARAVETASGTTQWSRQFEFAVGSGFAAQDSVAAETAAAVQRTIAITRP